MKRLAAVACFLTAAFGAAQAQMLNKEPLDKIVAVAEDDVILQSELDHAVANVLAQYSKNPQKLPPRDVLERQVLESLIMLRLQVARAKETGIRVSDADVDQAVQRVAAQNNIDVSQLRASLNHDGSDAEVDILLASNSLKAGEVHLQHILIATPNGADAAQIQAAHDKAESVKKEIDGGMDFTQAAIRYSSGQDALQGGDLGWRRYDEVPEAFADLVEGMQAGQVSQPLRGPSGFHIVKLVDKRNDGKQVVTEYHARHILIKTNEVTSSDEALKAATDIRHRIVDGHEDFAAVAKRDSQDANSAGSGGDMGWFPVDQYGTRVAEVVSTLKDGEISAPFQTDAGWHVLQRLGVREQDRTAEMKRDQAREIIRNRKAEEQYENFLRQLRSESYVEIRLPGAESSTADKPAP